VANPQQLAVLAGGLECWNEWRQGHPSELIDLFGADLTSIDLSITPAVRKAAADGLIPTGASWTFIEHEIIGYDIAPLDLHDADLRGSSLDGMDLRCANLQGAHLSGASLRGTQLLRADLAGARLVNADLTGALLRVCDLSGCVLIGTTIEDADLGFSRVYGVAVWDVIGTPRDESSLVVTPRDEAKLSVDSLALAQFLYLLIRNANVREAIDVLTTKLVLILGNFGSGEKLVLDHLRHELRARNYVPVVFDFEGPASKDITGTVETLARLSRFVVADLTNPSSVPHELATVVPFLRTTPVVLLRRRGATGYSMVRDLEAYPWVLAIHQYESESALFDELEAVIRPAEALADRLRSSP